MSTDNRFIPNSFQVPNALVDDLMAELGGVELKCYLLVIRKTKGWSKEFDAISLSQFMTFTGAGKTAVINALKNLVDAGLLVRKVGVRNTSVYAINLFRNSTSSESELVQKVNRTSSESEPVTSSESEHTKNNIKNTTQNTNKKTTQKNSLDLLAEFGIVGQLADDFITHRKACKAPITQTALEGFQREADKLGMPIAESVAYAIERGWRGFKAEWYRRDLNNQPAEQMPANKPKFSNDQSGWSAGVEVEVDGQLWKF